MNAHIDDTAEAWKTITKMVQDLRNEGEKQIVCFCLPTSKTELQVYTLNLEKSRAALKAINGGLDILPRNLEIQYPEFLWVGHTRQGLVVQLRRMPNLIGGSVQVRIVIESMDNLTTTKEAFDTLINLCGNENPVFSSDEGGTPMEVVWKDRFFTYNVVATFSREKVIEDDHTRYVPASLECRVQARTETVLGSHPSFYTEFQKSLETLQRFNEAFEVMKGWVVYRKQDKKKLEEANRAMVFCENHLEFFNYRAHGPKTIKPNTKENREFLAFLGSAESMDLRFRNLRWNITVNSDDSITVTKKGL